MAIGRVAAAAVAVLVAAGPATPARAEHEAQVGEHIASYDVAITVEQSGTLRVTETIDYDFGGEERHGIFRTIPVRFHHDDVYDRVYPIDDVEVVTRRGTPDDTEVSEFGGVTTIRIGDPDRTISGRHRYEIRYDVRGAINRFPQHDELYWNAIGAEWDVPVGSATVVVRAPAAAVQTTCIAGPSGSTLPCSGRRANGTVAHFSQDVLGPREALTVVVALPPGVVAEPGPILRERFSVNRAFARTPRTVTAAALLLAAALAGITRLAWRTGRDRRFAGQVPGLLPPDGAGAVEEHRPLFTPPAGAVQFAPPEGIKPALMGVLVDESADALDVTATIVDLAVRRHLRIDEIEMKLPWSRPDWRLTKLEPPADDLALWERTLLDALFDDRDTVRLADLKDKFHTDLRQIQRELYDDVMARRWFTKHPNKARGRWFGIGAAATAAGVGVTVLLARFTHAALLGVSLVVAGLVLLGLHRRMPARTGRGSAALAQALGFRQYLHTAEQAQLHYEEDAGVFARYLPYAVVLGETKRWARAFERLGAASQESVYWYRGSGDWTPSRFAESVSTFSVMSAGTVASTPSSSGSSGFSGGSSGGGGGGGGGGSW